MRAVFVCLCKTCRFPSLVPLSVLLLLAGLSTLGWAQDAAREQPVRPLITQRIDESRLKTLRGNIHPLARHEFDLGTAPASLPMERMLLVLKRSPDQQIELRRLLDVQQDKKSPSYHKWLTPSQFGRQFGPNDADMQTVVLWLQSHGFQVGSTKGRTVLEFSGSASQVQEAFHTSIHKYIVNGVQHWANSNDPSIPAALTPAVAGVLSLHNFIKKPASHFNPQAVPARIVPGKKPQVTFPQNGTNVHALAPDDYRVIYNMNSLTVSGQSSIAVIGRSNLYNGGADVSNFQSIFGGGLFSITLNGPDPGDLGGGEEAEATLDSSWSTALAPGANVQLVVSASTDTTDGIDLSEVYIIENNLAAIMTESFSACEFFATDGQLAGATALAEQAAAQGITYFVSTGDDGAEGCDDPNTPPASFPPSVNYLASTPFNVAVGGTMFNENGQDSLYWSTAAPISVSALSYIPENVWNESSLSNGLWAGSGGVSAGNILSGFGVTAGVPKPNWQSGVSGIPNDGVRDLPDVSLTAAAHDPYLLCLDGSCVPDSQGQIFVYFISGTSASAPSMAGIMALVNEQNYVQTGELRQGLANYVLYKLAAQSVYPSHCNGSNTSGLPDASCIFNDVTVGNNVVPGETGTLYQAGAGFDMATGLGSPNVGNLVSQWNSVTFNPTTTTLALTPTTNIAHGAPVAVNISVAPATGPGTPTGDVSLLAANALTSCFGKSAATDGGTLANGSSAFSTQVLPGGGPYCVWAHYAGDSTWAPSDSNTTMVTVTPEPSTTAVSVLTGDQNGNPVAFTGGPFGSFVYLRADVAGQSGQGVPTGNVTFNDSFGPIPGGGSFALNSEGNTATPNGVVSFDTGTHTISALYAGDPSFNSSNTTLSQTFTIAAGFFTSIPSAQSTVVIASPGGSGTTSVSVTSSSGFSGTIALTCAGLPSEATCTITPASISANGTASTNTAAITVTTTAARASSRTQRRSYLAAIWLMGFSLIIGCTFAGGKRNAMRFSALIVLAMMILIVPACGGGGGKSKTPPPDPGTPAGTSNITVSASSGSTTNSTGFTLVIQ
jgi:Pro-kumamolisin, activation domain/Bacterial Ig-like domain (group 3)